ncbi:MAG: 6-bladed beta-propeller, partial [Cytophagales bacterium]
MFENLLKFCIISSLLFLGVAQAQSYYSVARLGTGAAGNFSENDKFNYPNSVAVDSEKKIYVADTDNDRIHVWTQSGANFGYFNTIGSFGNLEGALRKPSGVAFFQDKIYVADTKNNRIQVFTQSGGNFGFYAFIAGTPNIGGYRDQPGQLNTELYEPKAVAVSANGTIYIGDTQNHRVQVWTQSGTNFGYLATMGTTGDNSSDNAKFYFPSSIALDAAGKIYVADWGNSRVQVWTQSGSNFGYYATIGATTVSGSSNNNFNGPLGVAVSLDNKIYVADANNSRIQVWTQSGANFGYFATVGKNGNGPNELFYPTGTFVDADGKLYVAENYGNRINIFDKCVDFTRIITQPTNQTLCPGGAGYFQVTATGTGLLSYAWSGGGPNSENLQTDIAGNYDVTVSGSCGIAISNTVALTTGIGTNWVRQPIGAQDFCQDSFATISVSATGTNVRYSWSGGITSTSPTITTTLIGTFYAYAEGDCGLKLQSNQSTTNILQSTTIVTAPVSQIILATASANLSVAAFGDNISYLWSSGETTTGINNKPAGTYSVSVIGICGIKTATATISISTVTSINTVTSVNTISSAIITFTGVGVQTFAGTSGNLFWNPLAGAATYCIRYSKSSNFTSTVKTVCGLTAPNYLFVLSTAGLRLEALDETFYYQVAGVDADGNQSQWSATQSFELRTEEIQIPTSLQGFQSSRFTIYPNPYTNGELKIENG